MNKGRQSVAKSKMSLKMKSSNLNPALVRLLFMLGFGVLAYILIWPILAMAVVQFGFHLIEGIPNARLANLNWRMISYLSQILDFICYRVEQKPFPFNTLPADSPIKKKKKTKSA